MAWAQKTANGYVGRYRVDGKVKSTRKFNTKRDAKAEAEAEERSGKLSTWVDPKRSTVTLSDYFAEWQRARGDVQPRTLETAAERFRSLIEPTFGDVPLKRIEYDDVRIWSATMMTLPSARRPVPERASQARRRDATQLLKSILDGAVDAKRLTSNPARTASGKAPYMPKASKTKPHRYLTHEELRRVGDAANHSEDRTLILLAGLTGLRWGEITALCVSDVDMLRGRIRVERAYTGLDDGSVILGPTKTHAVREVPVPPALRPSLEACMTGKGKDELLFSQRRDGKPLKDGSFTRHAFAPAVLAAGSAVSALQRLLGFEAEAVSGTYDQATVSAVKGLQAGKGLKVTGVCDSDAWERINVLDRESRDGMTQAEKVSRTRQLKTLARLTLGPGASDFDRLTLHDLRHTAASLAIHGGAGPKDVQNMLGHEDARLTMNTYAGLFESAIDDLGQRMSDAFEASSAQHLHTEASDTPEGVSILVPRNR